MSEDGAADVLADYRPRLEALAGHEGLDYYPVDFELVPDTFMMEVAIYGLPVRMPHWSFGVRYIYQHVQHRMGRSRIFEVVFPGNPNRAYLQSRNTVAENTLVTAHVLGHADFSRHNALFARMQAEVGWHIVEQAADRAHRIEDAIRDHGPERIERVLDAALALEQCVDLRQPLARPDYPEWVEAAERGEARDPAFAARFDALPGESPACGTPGHRPELPPAPEADLLWFIARHAPELEPWERDIFLAVREESFYFYPLFACQIMNEGWASYWHAHLLREADFLPGEVYVDAIKAHSDVVRPMAGEGRAALAINPYHLGFHIWERIIEREGIEAARRIRTDEDDFGFIRNHLDEELAEKLALFTWTRRGQGRNVRYEVGERDIDALREGLLAPKFNYGAPRVRVDSVGRDGSLVLAHDAATDGRGLDLSRAERVLEYIARVWRRPVHLRTVDADGRGHDLAAG